MELFWLDLDLALIKKWVVWRLFSVEFGVKFGLEVSGVLFVIFGMTKFFGQINFPARFKLCRRPLFIPASLV